MRRYTMSERGRARWDAMTPEQRAAVERAASERAPAPAGPRARG